MKIRLFLIAAIVTVIVAASASAGNWYANSAGTGNALPALGTERYVAFYVFNDSDSTHFSNVLCTQECDELTLVFHQDTSAASGTAEIRVWETSAACGSAVSASTGLTQISGDIDGDGVQDDQTLNGTSVNRRRLRKFWAQGLTLEVTTASASGDTPIAVLFCGKTRGGGQ